MSWGNVPYLDDQMIFNHHARLTAIMISKALKSQLTNQQLKFLQSGTQLDKPVIMITYLCIVVINLLSRPSLCSGVSRV